jgi:hypothetical protein
MRFFSLNSKNHGFLNSPGVPLFFGDSAPVPQRSQNLLASFISLPQFLQNILIHSFFAQMLREGQVAPKFFMRRCRKAMMRFLNYAELRRIISQKKVASNQ